ncbi:ankyrin repeat-containing protein [Arthroderma uncinatum]|uniref:ankyrin repeat-containing protein n=1 Tax=Arthroderma uncinatum TaxID=74035 RepID=UPI00144A8DDD|nr:ankyrin repeat-containing protein [Arthroderma uncinatum]KAF3491723.1 ankyrin repeat-containing protein [Arthroderma uncinatum]
MPDDEGASPREVVVEACRRDQPYLIDEIFQKSYKDKPDEFADFINGVTDSMGNHALHICASYGSYDAMDYLLDIYHFEVDPANRIDGDTPLHLAVRHGNEKDIDVGMSMLEMMLEAGCDPRVRNKKGQRPVDFVMPQYSQMKTALMKVEYMLQEGGGIEGHDDEDDEQSDGPSDDEEAAQTKKR